MVDTSSLAEDKTLVPVQLLQGMVIDKKSQEKFDILHIGKSLARYLETHGRLKILKPEEVQPARENAPKQKANYVKSLQDNIEAARRQFQPQQSQGIDKEELQRLIAEGVAAELTKQQKTDPSKDKDPKKTD